MHYYVKINCFKQGRIGVPNTDLPKSNSGLYQRRKRKVEQYRCYRQGRQGLKFIEKPAYGFAVTVKLNNLVYNEIRILSNLRA